jgi:hypothetical protein
MKSIMDAAKDTFFLYRTATSPIRLEPDFIIIGAQKGGTTSLFYYLADHPNIVGARRKEVHFFNNNFHKGMSWYRAQFPTSFHKYYAKNIRKRDFLTGEASPYYLPHPYAPQRIASHLPHVKLIVLLRNPVERAYSSYRHQMFYGFEHLSFEEAIACEEERMQEDLEKLQTSDNYYSHNHQHFSYLLRGKYAEQLEVWFKLFPREQFLIMKSEDFFEEPAAIYKQTLAFLNVPILEPKAIIKEGYTQYNKAQYTPPSKMDPALRKHLVEYFEPYNQRLYELVGRDFDWH